MISRKWSELANEADGLGLDVNTTMTKQEIISLLAAAKSTGRALMQIPCQLAKDFRDLNERQQAAILASNLYVAEEKYDGCRAKLHITNSMNYIDTRHQSVETYHYGERTDNFPHLRNLLFPGWQGTILDGEMRMPTTSINDGKTQTVDGLTTTAAVFNSDPKRAVELQLCHGNMQFIVFDILFDRGKDVRNEEWYKRYQRLQRFLDEQFHDAPSEILEEFKFSPVYTKDLLNVYKRFTTESKEGIMLKHKHSLYSSKEGSRQQHVWYKC